MINLLDVIHLMMKYQLSSLIPVTNREGHSEKAGMEIPKQGSELLHGSNGMRSKA